MATSRAPFDLIERLANERGLYTYDPQADEVLVPIGRENEPQPVSGVGRFIRRIFPPPS